MERARQEAYWNIDDGGKSWFDELSAYAKTVVNFRLNLADDDAAKLQGQYDLEGRLLVFDPYRVKQQEEIREQLKEVYAQTVDRSVIIRS